MKLYKYCSLPDLEKYQSLLTNLKISKPNDLNDPFEGFFSKIDLQKRIGCLSGTAPTGNNDSIYMWSFYANALKGICIKYEFQNSLNDKSIKHGPVKYIVRCAKNKKISLFHKYLSWVPEQEYRFIFSGEIPEFYPINELSLKVTGIYLGVGLLGGHPVDVKERNKSMRELKIYNWLASNLSKDVPIYVCARNRQKYKVVHKKLN